MSAGGYRGLMGGARFERARPAPDLIDGCGHDAMVADEPASDSPARGQAQGSIGFDPGALGPGTKCGLPTMFKTQKPRRERLDRLAALARGGACGAAVRRVPEVDTEVRARQAVVKAIDG